MRFEYPFLFFGNCEYGIKLAWILFATFLLILSVSKRFRRTEINFEKLRRFACQEIPFYISTILCWWLPDVTGGTSGIADFAETLLKWEILISVLLLFLLAWRWAYQAEYGNREQYLDVVERLGKFLILLFIACTMTSRVITWGKLIPRIANIGWMAFLWGNMFYLGVLKNAKKANTSRNGNAERQTLTARPLEHFQDLSEKQKRLATKLAKLLANESESRSICVSGEWGSGKTSVVNGALDKLWEQHPDYHEIRINALDLDTAQDLLNYVYESIRTLLKESGVYVGIGSDYREFLLSVSKDLTDEHLVSLVEQTIVPSVSDYRERREAMEKLLQHTLRGRRIIIVLDDIERCDEKKAKEFVFFAREVAALSHCAVIFITDYKYLREKLTGVSVSNDDSELENQDTLYFEKFFDIRFDVPNAESVPIIKHFQVELNGKLDVVPVPSKSFDELTFAGGWFSEEAFQILDDIIRPLKKRALTDPVDLNKLTKIQTVKERLVKEKERLETDLSNFRKLVKIFQKLIEYYETIEEAFSDCQEADKEKLKNFLNIIQSEDVLFFLAYLYLCFPNEYRRLQSDVSQYFQEFQGFSAFSLSEGWDVSRSLIGKLGDGLFFDIQDDSGENDNGLIKKAKISNPYSDEEYIRSNRIRFIEALLSRTPKEELQKAVKPFTREAEELLEQLDAQKADEVKARLDDAVRYACENSGKENRKTNETRRNTLLQYAKELLDEGTWGANELLSCFMLNIRPAHIRLPFMKGIYNMFCERESNSTWIQSIQREVIRDILGTSSDDLYKNLSYVDIPLTFYSNLDLNNQVWNPLREISVDGDETAYLKRFLETLRDNRERIFPKLDEQLLSVSQDADSGEMLNILYRLKEQLATDLRKCQTLFGANIVGQDVTNEDMLKEMGSAIENIDYFIKFCAKLRGILEEMTNGELHPHDGTLTIEDIEREIARINQVLNAELNPDDYSTMILKGYYQRIMLAIERNGVNFPSERAEELIKHCKSLLEIASKLQFSSWEISLFMGILYAACQDRTNSCL